MSVQMHFSLFRENNEPAAMQMNKEFPNLIQFKKINKNRKNESEVTFVPTKLQMQISNAYNDFSQNLGQEKQTWKFSTP